MAKQSGKDASNLFERLAENRQSGKPAATPEAIAPISEAPRGRAKGKRSDPNYIQVGARIPKDLKKDVERRLVDEPFDFSDLVADLLVKWLADSPDNQSDG